MWVGNDCRHSTGNNQPGILLRTAVRTLNMHMPVDQPRNQEGSLGIDNLQGRRKILPAKTSYDSSCSSNRPALGQLPRKSPFSFVPLRSFLPSPFSHCSIEDECISFYLL